MATKKTTTETPNDTSSMSIFSKLLAVRKDFNEQGATKSGKNLHAEFCYFELEDIVPKAEGLFVKYNILMMTTFENGNAIARIVNIDKPEETIEFTIPMQFIAEPAKFRMNEVQGVGAAVTYYRRYLYMIVLDLVEKDELDNDTPDETPTPPKKKPATSEDREKIKKSLTNTEAPADMLQINALKAALKKLKEIDSTQEEFIQEIAIKTEGFKNINKSTCEKLILNINEMIENYNIEEEE